MSGRDKLYRRSDRCDDGKGACSPSPHVKKHTASKDTSTERSRLNGPNVHIGFGGGHGDGGQCVGDGGQQKRHDGSRNRREVRPPSYKRLEELLNKDKEHILLQLSSDNFGFEKLLKETNDIRRDLRALVCSVIVRACECTDISASLNSFLGKVQKSMFVKYHMIQHIISLKEENHQRVNYEVEITNIMTVIKALVDCLPSSTHDIKASLMLLEPTINDLQKRGLIYDNSTQLRFNELNEFVKAVESTQGEAIRSIPRQKVVNVDEDTPPPNDFREIPIFPTLEDLTIENRPYLRENRLDGSYENVDHYLDVQYRLLREDMVRPLREGIIDYLQHRDDRNRQITDIRVYNDVTIEYPVCAREGIIYRVHIDVSRLKGIRWQSSKRLIYGSLVCLSADNFQTVRFATVANREITDLEKGFLELKFENVDELENRQNQRFVMVETSSFFESYRHVLQSLQNITEHTMPMGNYIIRACRNVNAPLYLRNKIAMTYDFAPFVGNFSQSTRFRIADNQWPTAESLELDKSQFQAFKTALTKEFAVIQGPPGTGKTYVGLKIVNVLLHNTECWTSDAARVEKRESPVFVVCFTNHALDQFLEGIHSFLPDGIVRVGGRSKSDTLKKFNLVQLRKESQEQKEIPRYILDRKKDLLRKMSVLREVMENANEKIKQTTNGIIDEFYLEAFMSDRHIESLKQDKEKYTFSIISWLGLYESTYDNTDKQFGVTEINEEDPIENEELEVAEEADLIMEQRVIDVDEIDTQEIGMRETDRIKNTVRKQLAFDLNKRGQFQDRDGFQVVTKKKKVPTATLR